MRAQHLHLCEAQQSTQIKRTLRFFYQLTRPFYPFAWAGFKPAQAGCRPCDTYHCVENHIISWYKNSPPLEGCPQGRGGHIPPQQTQRKQASKRQKLHRRKPPRRFAPPLHRRGIPFPLGEGNCVLTVRSCENVRTKQPGEDAIPKEDAPCFDIIFPI